MKRTLGFAEQVKGVAHGGIALALLLADGEQPHRGILHPEDVPGQDLGHEPNWKRCTGLESTLAPTSMSTTGFFSVGMTPARAAGARP